MGIEKAGVLAMLALALGACGSPGEVGFSRADCAKAEKTNAVAARAAR